MALSAFGIKKSETALGTLLVRSGEPGTPNRALAEAAELLKLNYSVKRDASIVDLQWHLAQKFAIIISYFDIVEHVGHFAVVKGIDKKNIHLLDPWYGPHHQYLIDDFLTNWHSGFDKDKRWFIAIKKA